MPHALQIRAARPHGRRSLGAAIAALAAIALALAPAPARAATGPEFFGTNLQTLGVITDQQRVRAELAAGRMTVSRYEVRWPLVEGTAPVAGVPQYTWDGPDAMIGSMAAAGLRVAPLFRFSPGWAHRPDPSKPGGVDVLPPSSYGDFAAMIVAFARRYGPSGEFWASRPELRPQPTLTYEIWNEVNLDQYAWNDQADPAAYAALLAVVRPALKAAQPGAVVMAGGLAWQRSGKGVHPDYVEQLGKAGGLALLDAVGYHPYAPDAQSTLDLVAGMRRELAAAGFPNLPIYVNEAGQEAVVTNPDGTRVPDRAPARFGYERYPSDAARAANLALAGEALAASDCGVEQFLPYAAGSTEDATMPLTEGYMGLFRRYGGAPTQSAQGLQRAARRWAARFDAGGPGAPTQRLAICSPERGSEESALLRLGARFTFPAAGCVEASVSYDGNPLESAQLRLLAPGGAQLAVGRSDAFGAVSACIPTGLRGQAFVAVTELPGVARATILECNKLGSGCPPGLVIESADRSVSAAALLPDSPAPAPPAPSCTWQLGVIARGFTAQRGARPPRRVAARVRRSGKGVGTQAVRLRAGCATQPAQARLRVEVAVRRKGTKRFATVLVLRLINGKPRDVKVAGLRRGDRLRVVQRASRTAPIAASRTLTIGSKSARAAKRQ